MRNIDLERRNRERGRRNRMGENSLPRVKAKHAQTGLDMRDRRVRKRFSDLPLLNRNRLASSEPRKKFPKNRK